MLSNMKYLAYIFIIFSCFNIELSAQEVPLIHTSNAFWEYGKIGYNYTIKYRIYPYADTVIGTNVYTIYKNESYYHSDFSNDTVKSVFNTYIRIDDGKILRKEADGSNSMIFDSSWNIGDTIEIVDGHIRYFLSSIDTVSLGGFECRRWIFNQEFFENRSDYNGVFIEGIGGLYSPLINDPISGIYILDYFQTLDCFTLNENWVIGDRCELGTHYRERNNIPKFSVFVEQENNIIRIQSESFNTASTELKLFDINGKVLLKKSILSGDFQIAYPPSLNGFYIIEVVNMEDRLYQKVLIW